MSDARHDRDHVRHGVGGPDTGLPLALTGEAACWNSIGVRGDRSCPELVQHVHCRNCPTYSAAAMTILDGELSERSVREQTAHFAAPRTFESSDTEPIVVFRVGDEWLALPMAIVAEVAEIRPIRTVPHRRGGLVLGVANVRGELVVSVSLSRVLGLDRAEGRPLPVGAAVGAAGDAGGVTGRRLLVLRSDDTRVVAPVDEVAGIHRVPARELKDVPTIVARATAAYSRAVVYWSGRSVGLLDGPRLMRSLRGHLS